jgi:hypothetical protein
MEIQGVDEKGYIVSAKFSDFAKENTQEGETFGGVGSTPAHARYYKGDQVREVDLRDLAGQAGLKQVKFNFDLKMAKEQGLVSEQGIDQSVAYNIERIRSDDGRRQYLKDKGMTNTFNNGDDYYQTANGWIKPVNNRDGFDLSDLTRMGAKAGRDLGAAAGAIATGIGAAATGGMAIPFVAAASGVGAAAGEMAQRGVDKLIGAEAAKYNAKMSGSEEIANLSQDVAVGAVTGALGQVASRGLGYVAQKGAKGISNAVARIGNEKATEWTAKVASRQEASYLQSTLPGKWLQNAGSAEEARAMELLKGSLQPGKNSDAVMQGVAEAKTELALGKAKRTQDVVETGRLENQQKELRDFAKARLLEKEAKDAELNAAQLSFDKTLPDREAAYRSDKIQNAKDVFSGHADDMETIFSPLSDSNQSLMAAAKVEKSVLDNLEKSTKVIINRGDKGRALNIDEASLQDFTTSTMNKQADEVGAYADRQAFGAFNFVRAPSEREKEFLGTEVKAAISNIEKVAGQMGDKEAKGILGSLARLKNATDGHNDLNTEDTGFIFRKFLGESREYSGLDTLPPSVHESIRNLNNSLFFYAEGFSKNPRALGAAYHAQSKVLDVKDLLRQEIHQQDGGIEFLVSHLEDMGKVGGDTTGIASSRVASMWHLKSQLDGTPSKAWSLMNDVDRAQFGALDAVRKADELVPKKPMAAPTEEGLLMGLARHGVAGAVASLAGSIGGPVAAMTTYGMVAGGLKKGAVGKTAKVLGKAGGMTVKSISKTAANARVQNIAGAQVLRKMTGAEEYMGKKLQNFTNSGDTNE